MSTDNQKPEQPRGNKTVRDGVVTDNAGAYSEHTHSAPVDGVVAGAPRIFATIQPQYWGGRDQDEALDAGPSIHVDITDIYLRKTAAEREALTDNSDEGDNLYFELVEAGLAPEGFGPFYVQLEQSVADYNSDIEEAREAREETWTVPTVDDLDRTDTAQLNETVRKLNRQEPTPDGRSITLAIANGLVHWTGMEWPEGDGITFDAKDLRPIDGYVRIPLQGDTFVAARKADGHRVLGMNQVGGAIVEGDFNRPDGTPFTYALTTCCSASEKGLERGIGCRGCYRLLEPEESDWTVAFPIL